MSASYYCKKRWKAICRQESGGLRCKLDELGRDSLEHFFVRLDKCVSLWLTRVRNVPTSRCSTVLTANCISISSALPAVLASNGSAIVSRLVKLGAKVGFYRDFCRMMSKQSQIPFFLNRLSKSSRCENVPQRISHRHGHVVSTWKRFGSRDFEATWIDCCDD